MSPCDIPFCSLYPRIVVPIFIEIETASTEPFVTSTGIVCMSAISHKVNTQNWLVNGYLWGSGDSCTSPGSSRASYPLKPEALLEPIPRSEPLGTLLNQLLDAKVANRTAIPPASPNPSVHAAKILRRGHLIHGRIL